MNTDRQRTHLTRFDPQTALLKQPRRNGFLASFCTHRFALIPLGNLLLAINLLFYSRPMPKITVDGKSIEARQGQMVLQACNDAGVHIPQYCYHPGLSIVASCRICLVEVEGIPKLVPACQTAVRDGPGIDSSFKVDLARGGVGGWGGDGGGRRCRSRRCCKVGGNRPSQDHSRRDRSHHRGRRRCRRYWRS